MTFVVGVVIDPFGDLWVKLDHRRPVQKAITSPSDNSPIVFSSSGNESPSKHSIFPDVFKPDAFRLVSKDAETNAALAPTASKAIFLLPKFLFFKCMFSV